MTLYESSEGVNGLRVKGPYAKRIECESCVAQVGDRCMALSETQWITGECPFWASPLRLKRDAELLQKAIKEGRVKESQDGK